MAEKLTRESLREWATSKVAEIPTVVLSSIEEKEVPNSVERVLRAVMLRHHNLALSEYTKPELIEDLLRCLMNGIEKPRRDMTVDELLDAILGENFERYGFETVADIDEWCDLEGLESDWMFRYIMTPAMSSLESLTQEELDERVHDRKSGEAAAINNEGREAQIEYLQGN